MVFVCLFQSTARLGSSPLPYLPEVQQSSSVLSMYSRQSSLLSSLTISAAQEYKERRHLGDLLLPDNVSVALEGKNRRTLSEKVEPHIQQVLRNTLFYR